MTPLSVNVLDHIHILLVERPVECEYKDVRER